MSATKTKTSAKVALKAEPWDLSKFLESKELPAHATEQELNIIRSFEKFDKIEGGTWSCASDSAHAYLRKNNKEALFNHLRRLKIGSIDVRFDGSGDSGQIESIDFYSSKGGKKGIKVSDKEAVEGYVAHQGTSYHPEDKENKKPSYRSHNWRLRLNLKDAVEDFCYSILEHKHAGWEINEGSFGCFTFAVGDNDLTCELDMNERVEEVISSTEAF